MGGQFEIESAPGAGTTVRAIIPYDRTQAMLYATRKGLVKVE